MARARQEGATAMDSLSAGERTGTSGMTRAEVHRKMGVPMEEGNAGEDIERFRVATDADRAEDLRQAVLVAEATHRAAGHEPDRDPAPRFPEPRE